jgi:hypothetical protein
MEKMVVMAKEAVLEKTQMVAGQDGCGMEKRYVLERANNWGTSTSNWGNWGQEVIL